MKYLNDSHDGCIGPQNHPVFIPKKIEIDSFLKFSGDGSTFLVNMYYMRNHWIEEVFDS